MTECGLTRHKNPSTHTEICHRRQFGLTVPGPNATPPHPRAALTQGVSSRIELGKGSPGDQRSPSASRSLGPPHPANPWNPWNNWNLFSPRLTRPLINDAPARHPLVTGPPWPLQLAHLGPESHSNRCWPSPLTFAAPLGNRLPSLAPVCLHKSDGDDKHKCHATTAPQHPRLRSRPAHHPTTKLTEPRPPLPILVQ
ncbi:hypothetical protein BKA56DRAFT_619878 [Ilyonectria sp. MPI-CAGE-AT-0026]|nr:hypothetical protein BKA56DRAFT_619878 [Ilyonectria sp. MPI-CAGE-AT-0026]